MLVCLCVLIINLSFKHKAKQAVGQDNFFLCQNGIAKQVCVEHVLVCKADGLKNPLCLGKSCPRKFFGIVSPWESHVKRAPSSERRPLWDAKGWMVDTPW